MSKIADAIFTGLLNGSSRGLADYIASSSKTEEKTQNVGKAHLTDRVHEATVVPAPGFDGQRRRIVGWRSDPVRAMAAERQAALLNPAPEAKRVESDAGASTSCQTEGKTQDITEDRFANRAEESSVVPAPGSDGQGRRIVGWRSDPVRAMAAERQAALLNPAPEAKRVESDAGASTSCQTEGKTQDIAEDRFANHAEASSVRQAVLPSSTPEAKGYENDAGAAMRPLADVSVLPSYDMLKTGFKDALMKARREAGLDGSSGKEKLHLHELVTLAANKRLYSDKITKPDRKYDHVVALAGENIDALIKSIDPRLDVNIATTKVLFEASDKKRSSDCVEKGALAIRECIRKRNRQVQALNTGSFVSQAYESSMNASSSPLITLDSSSSMVLSKQSHSTGSVGVYLLGLGEIALGGAIMASGFALEVVTVGGFTLGLGVTTGTGAFLMGHGLSLTTQHVQDISFEKRSSPPGPNPKAEGAPHTIIEIPGPAGQYTTHNGDGTWKQYRGSGKPHGPIPRPNVKENKNNPSPSGPRPGNPNVREPRVDEIPTGK